MVGVEVDRGVPPGRRLLKKPTLRQTQRHAAFLCYPGVRVHYTVQCARLYRSGNMEAANAYEQELIKQTQPRIGQMQRSMPAKARERAQRAETTDPQAPDPAAVEAIRAWHFARLGGYEPLAVHDVCFKPGQCTAPPGPVAYNANHNAAHSHHPRAPQGSGRSA